MTIQSEARAEKMLGRGPNKVACAHEIGDFQYVVLRTIERLAAEVTVNKVLRHVLEETDDLLDVAQIYTAINTAEKNGWVKATGKVPSVDGGRPLMGFAITAEGRKALSSKIEHMLRLVGFGQHTRVLAGFVQKIRGTPGMRERAQELVAKMREELKAEVRGQGLKAEVKKVQAGKRKVR